MSIISSIVGPIVLPVVTGLVGGGGAAQSTLLNGLVSWWSLDEASGTRVDSHGNNNLTDNNTVTQAVGKVGNAAQFTAVNLEYLSRAAGHGLEANNRDFTIAAWIYADSFAAGFPNIGRVAIGSAASDADWMLVYDTAAAKAALYVPTGNTWFTAKASTFGALSLSTYYLAIAEYKTSTQTIGISINDGVMDTAVGGANTNNTGNGFEMGRYSTTYWDGRHDEQAFWSRLLTADEKTELYNSGAGMAYPG